MKYYKDNQNNVYAYELDGSQDHLIGDKVAMTVEEVEAHLNPPITLEQSKVNKKQELESAFNAELEQPVTVGTKSYNGGNESAQAIRDYIQAVSESGGTVYTIWDSSNDIANYTLEEANAIKLAIANVVLENEFKLRTKKNDVDSATTIEAVNAIVW